MTDTDLQPLVASTYLALADLLEGTPESGWNTQSLCEAWRVREVVAHVTMPARYTEEQFMAELAQDEFDFTRLSNRIASRDAQLPTDPLVATLRDPGLHQWTPPGGGAAGALNHAVIHSLDITVPLDAAPSASEAAVRSVLDELTKGGGHQNFGTTLEGRSLHAVDIDWTFGSGDPLSGTAADLAAHICGRALSEGRLDGAPLTRG